MPKPDIQHFVVLMMENRSFDHIFGFRPGVNGLKGTEIPIGARILSAVDCLDALASDRQYRRALPLGKAMEMVAEQSGKSFDPEVVQILKERYIELEQLARGSKAESFTLSTDIKIERGAAGPLAGRPVQMVPCLSPFFLIKDFSQTRGETR